MESRIQIKAMPIHKTAFKDTFLTQITKFRFANVDQLLIKCSKGNVSYFINVADPGSGAFLTPGSGMVKKSRVRIRDEHFG
jgi:hypothetical protein